jgi:hypothetical protein
MSNHIYFISKTISPEKIEQTLNKISPLELAGFSQTGEGT